jgi:hypothetical protein
VYLLQGERYHEWAGVASLATLTLTVCEPARVSSTDAVVGRWTVSFRYVLDLDPEPGSGAAGFLHAVVDLVDHAGFELGEHGLLLMRAGAATVDSEVAAQEHATHGGAIDRALVGREVCELALGAADVSTVRHFWSLLSSANSIYCHYFAAFKDGR